MALSLPCRGTRSSVHLADGPGGLKFEHEGKEAFVARRTLGVALVGVGAAAQINHIPALKKTDGVELIALVDRDRCRSRPP